jgi:dTDP-4-amino-4,6-dideoxygalactose transaminase
MRSFGFDEEGNLAGLGINAKMSEMHAAMGLCNLEHIERILAAYRSKWARYYELLKNDKLQLLTITPDTDFNCSYFPVVFRYENQLVEFLDNANAEGIYPRRYFYPSLNALQFLGEKECPVSESIASRVVCLPLYFDLDPSVQLRIAELARTAANAVIDPLSEQIVIH